MELQLSPPCISMVCTALTYRSYIPHLLLKPAKLFFPMRVLNQIFVHLLLICVCYTLRPSILLDLVTILVENITFWSSSLRNFLQWFLILSHLGPYILSLFHQKEELLHPHKTGSETEVWFNTHTQGTHVCACLCVLTFSTFAKKMWYII